ncbi:AhpA/YtjB family protein [Thalassotalea litorea]|uniref:AhpA/YtjB family protein n=1 Tax=Thalassotalea litorea TaxID=2020715 RepID=UPI0037361F6F
MSTMISRIKHTVNRLLPIFMAIVLLIIIFNSSIVRMYKNEQVMIQHVEDIARGFIDQVALSAKILLQQNQRQGLRRFTEQLKQNPWVEQVLVYDHNGQLIAHSQGAEKIVPQLEQGAISSSPYQAPYVAEIRDTDLLGYIRINFNADSLVDDFNERQRDNLAFILMLLLGAMVVLYWYNHPTTPSLNFGRLKRK